MKKTITVKGTGKASARPDLIVITLTVKALDKDYEKAMNNHSTAVGKLGKALSAADFEKEDLKTASFSVDTEYRSVRDKNGDYKNVFVGYKVNSTLNLEFDFDTKHLSKTLSAIASSKTDPEMNIRFTVRDADSLKNEMLRNAAANARSKAEILCAASGTNLGELKSVNYSWSDQDIYSDTSFEDRCFGSAKACSYDIEPEDVDISDTVTFVWEMN